MRPGSVEQPAGLVRDEHLVAEPLDRGDGLGTSRRAPRRHHRLLVPVQQLGDVSHVCERRHSLA
jgi:hypothetical protein